MRFTASTLLITLDITQFLNDENRICFLPFVTYKFRRSIEPFLSDSGSRKANLKASGDILIGFSGGQGSTVLLDLVWKTYFDPARMSEIGGGTAHPRKGNVWDKGVICYIDVRAAFPDVCNLLSLLAR